MAVEVKTQRPERALIEGATRQPGCCREGGEGDDDGEGLRGGLIEGARAGEKENRAAEELQDGDKHEDQAGVEQ